MRVISEQVIKLCTDNNQLGFDIRFLLGTCSPWYGYEKKKVKQERKIERRNEGTEGRGERRITVCLWEGKKRRIPTDARRSAEEKREVRMKQHIEDTALGVLIWKLICREMERPVFQPTFCHITSVQLKYPPISWLRVRVSLYP